MGKFMRQQPKGQRLGEKSKIRGDAYWHILNIKNVETVDHNKKQGATENPKE
jgi:hypothetical protein